MKKKISTLTKIEPGTSGLSDNNNNNNILNHTANSNNLQKFVGTNASKKWKLFFSLDKTLSTKRK